MTGTLSLRAATMSDVRPNCITTKQLKFTSVRYAWDIDVWKCLTTRVNPNGTRYDYIGHKRAPQLPALVSTTY